MEGRLGCRRGKGNTVRRPYRQPCLLKRTKSKPQALFVFQGIVVSTLFRFSRVPDIHTYQREKEPLLSGDPLDLSRDSRESCPFYRQNGVNLNPHRVDIRNP